MNEPTPINPATSRTLDENENILVRAASKTFVLHAQEGRAGGRAGGVIPVFVDACFSVRAGECVALTGPSGAGKSTLLRLLYGNYKIQSGCVCVRHRFPSGESIVNIAQAEPHEVLDLRRRSLGYVSQFLRVIPRVPAIDIVAEPLLAVGWEPEDARARAGSLLARLNIREALWPLSPLTFSGGEQQRVNIARGFAHVYPTLLLDEPTASLDAANREVVLSLIEEAKADGAAIVGIFHDAAARARVADREIDVGGFAAAA